MLCVVAATPVVGSAHSMVGADPAVTFRLVAKPGSALGSKSGASTVMDFNPGASALVIVTRVLVVSNAVRSDELKLDRKNGL